MTQQDTYFASGLTSKDVKWEVHNGDSLQVLKGVTEETFNCVVTSPPYFWLRHYGVDGQIGLEGTVAEYVSAIADVMSEVYRVLRSDGVLFLKYL